MKKLILGLLVFGLTTQFYAQVINDGMLPEVEVRAMNYKYLNSVDNTSAPVQIKLLEREVANYNVLESDLYSDEYDTYSVSFYIPEGRIVAVYDDEGILIRTIEKFQNIKVPKDVSKSVAKRFPGFIISKDTYKVSYHRDGGVSIQEYKLTLKNGDQLLKVKTDPKGKFI